MSPLPVPAHLPLCADSGPLFQLQICAQAQYAPDPEKFIDDHSLFRRGDIIGLTGSPLRTKSGELSISPVSMTLLTPNLHMLPTSHFGLKDQEVRYRKRYLDLMLNNQTREIFITRAKVVNYIRKYLDTLGFLEVLPLAPSSCFLRGLLTEPPPPFSPRRSRRL